MIELRRHCRIGVVVGSLVVGLLAIAVLKAQTPQAPQPFGGVYAELGERRQRLVDDWVARFARTNGQTVAPGKFYDEVLSLSAKTTFDAATQALMTTPLTDASGRTFGDGLALVDRVDAVRGEVPGAASDRQFRIYVRLTSNARDLLARSQEFKRSIDNAVYHRGYPMSYREQGGTPSIQISLALDGRQADIDVDYRSSSFPFMLLNGHLTAANSDVRAGSNAQRHADRWAGFQNWWHGVFGIHLSRPADIADTPSALAVPKVPRVGRKAVDVMANDFLQAWLVEGNVAAAMAYVSDRSYACLADEASNPDAFDRGMAPFQLMTNLRAVHEALGSRGSLDGLTTGVRLATPALKVINQPYHARFVAYDVPDDLAAGFECDRRLLPRGTKDVKRAYGNYAGATFYITGRQNERVTLLWAKDGGYWKIVSWKVGLDDGDSPIPVATPDVTIARIKADPDFARTTRSFLETWLIRRDYDAAFRYLSRRSYACYDLERGADAPRSTSIDDAGQKIRVNMADLGNGVEAARTLDALLTAPEPVHPSVRAMNHPYSRAFTLTSLPTALADAADCGARASGTVPPDPLPLEYGEAFGMSFRFGPAAEDAPVLRLLWRREDGTWKITSYDVERP